MKNINSPFFVDGHYRDRMRSYVVLELSDITMKIKYEDEETEILDEEGIAIKARIYNNIISEVRRNHPYTEERYFKSIGFLSNFSRFEAELPEKSVPNFINNYQRLTGENIMPTHTGISLLGEVDKWGPELRIYFPIPSFRLYFGPNIEPRAGQTPEVLRINNNLLWLRLVGVGFRLGKIHNIDEMRKTLPPEMGPCFEEGRKG